jgi:two-component system response regulator NreC
MKKRQILIADDHSVVRGGLRLIIESSEEYHVVGEAEGGEEAIALAGELRPDLVFMDISMPGMNGIEATTKLRERLPEVKVVILSVHNDEEYVFQALRAGACGYVHKTANKKEVLDAIKAALSGDRFFSPGISKLMLESFISRQKKEASPQPARGKHASSLTKRESEILKYISQGYTNRKIAEMLLLSIRTVNTHRTNLMQKLDIHDTAMLVRHAIKEGLTVLGSGSENGPQPVVKGSNL